MNLSKHPILRQCYELIQAIEACGASVELTHAVTLAGNLMDEIDKLVDRLYAPSVFNSQDNLWFARRENGDVRILKFDSTPKNFPYMKPDDEYPDAVVDITLPHTSWASVVCSVSVQGETYERWVQAGKFHQEGPDESEPGNH